MKVKIKGKEFELHYSMRIYILYENIMGQSLSNVTQGTTTSMVVLMFCAILASMQYHRIETHLNYEEFMDWLDEQPPTVFSEFSDWFTSAVTAYSSVKKGSDEEGKEDVKPDPNA